MKNRKNIICIAALCVAVFGLSACFNLDTDDNQGSIHINLGSVGERLTVNDIEKENMTYSITLTSDGQKTITDKFNSAARIIKVPVGIWAVKIEAEQERSGRQYRVLKGRGDTETGVEVIAGEITPVVVNMTTTATRVYTWDDLCSDLADTALKNLEYIEIADNLIATKTAESRGTVRREINIRAGKNITIDRGSVLKAPLFRIYNALTLEGKIIFDGGKESSGNDNTSALLNVELGGHLIMRDEVTLRNNNSFNGGGVYVETGGRFTMSGGTISGNTADRGGGVFVRTDGFNKTGGTIYGIDPNSLLSNQASAAGGGHAVYINGIGRDNTLSTVDNWP
jgi:hypothetical protein